jgi:hypothetical protein
MNLLALRVNSLKEATLCLQHHWVLGHNATLWWIHFIAPLLASLVLSLALEEYRVCKVLHIWWSTTTLPQLGNLVKWGLDLWEPLISLVTSSLIGSKTRDLLLALARVIQATKICYLVK